MHFHNILLQIQYSVTKPIEILGTVNSFAQISSDILAEV